VKEAGDIYNDLENVISRGGNFKKLVKNSAGRIQEETRLLVA
jgi:hypothetical protein